MTTGERIEVRACRCDNHNDTWITADPDGSCPDCGKIVPLRRLVEVVDEMNGNYWRCVKILESV